MRRVGLYIGLLAAGWLVDWLVPGLILGQPAILLTRQAPLLWKTVYLVVLYCWLLLATGYAWKHFGPGPGSADLSLRPGWVRLYTLGLALGLAMVVGSRLILVLAGHWTPPPASPTLLGLALLAAPLVAVAEELVFRGFLFQVTRESLGRPAAYFGVNVFFAVVHFFRPGALEMRLALVVALLLAGILLSLLLEASGSLWMPVGVHSAWVFAQVVDPPGRSANSWFWGLGGDPLAGVLGWVLLVATLLPFVAGAVAARPASE